MNKYGMVVIRFGQKEKLNFSFLIGKRLDDEFVITLFDENFAVVGRFMNIDQEPAILDMYQHISTNIGDIFEIFEIPSDPLLIAMLRKLRR